MKVGIIGGGACGLVVARILQENNIPYILFEKNKIGKKILASGNGKANIYNTNVSSEFYNDNFAYDLVSKMYAKLLIFLQRIGLYTKTDSEGRTYPYSESSLTVLNCLVDNYKHILEDFEVKKIVKKDNQFFINDLDEGFDYLVLASGSMAGMIKAKQNGYNSYLESLNLKTAPLKPSLVGFKLANYPNSLSGIRAKALVSLYQDTKLIHQEQGEVIFKDDGISGICILNLSYYYNQLKDKNNCQISLNFIPNYEVNISSKKELLGLLNMKLANYICEFQDLNHHIRNLTFDIIGTYDFEFCQVVSGGIVLDQINEDLSLKQESQIFVGGEVLDVDGACGGYNLMFAFSCGLLIGEMLCNIK